MPSAQQHHVKVVPYDESWPEEFQREASALTSTLAAFLVGPIEHIGSTAVPGLSAKPVIDIMVPVASLSCSRPCIALLEEKHSYTYWPYKKELMHWFCKPGEFVRTHHVHIVPGGGQLFRERLAFRDALRDDAATRRDYTTLKARLAAEHPRDREAYSEGKSAFVAERVARRLGPGA